MTTHEERVRDTIKTKELVEEIVGDNHSAFDYLRMLCRITRTLDDVYDGDNPNLSQEEVLEVMEYLFIQLPTNSFYATNQDILLSQHLSMYNGWMAANKREDGDETDKIYAHVWRDNIFEVFPIVALLIGGPEHMKNISEKIRIMFKKKLGE